MFIPVQGATHQRAGLGVLGNDNASFKRDSAANSTTSSSEVVEISSGNELERVSERLANFPPIQDVRLGQISAEIESGAYEIDLRALADAMLLAEFNITPNSSIK